MSNHSQSLSLVIFSRNGPSIQTECAVFVYVLQRYTRGRAQHILLDTLHIHGRRCVHEKTGIRSAFSGNRQLNGAPRRSAHDTTHEVLPVGGVHAVLPGECDNNSPYASFRSRSQLSSNTLNEMQYTYYNAVGLCTRGLYICRVSYSYVNKVRSSKLETLNIPILCGQRVETVRKQLHSLCAPL